MLRKIIKIQKHVGRGEYGSKYEVIPTGPSLDHKAGGISPQANFWWHFTTPVAQHHIRLTPSRKKILDGKQSVGGGIGQTCRQFENSFRKDQQLKFTSKVEVIHQLPLINKICFSCNKKTTEIS